MLYINTDIIYNEISGYTGFNCENALDPCTPNPCAYGTTCSAGAGNTFSCSCGTSKVFYIIFISHIIFWVFLVKYEGTGYLLVNVYCSMCKFQICLLVMALVMKLM